MNSSTSSTLINRLQGIVTFKAPVYKEVAEDTTATNSALIVVVITVVINIIAGALLSQDRGIVAVLLISIVSALVSWLIGSWLTAFVAKTFFQGTTNTGEMLRVLGHTYIFNVLGIIPVIGSLAASILIIIANVIGIREAAGFDTTKAILTAIIVGVIVFVIIAVISGIIIAAFVGIAAVSGQ